MIETMEGLEHYPLVFCPLCKRNQPVVWSEMTADDTNDHDAIDIMCGECQLVIATLHENTDDD